MMKAQRPDIEIRLESRSGRSSGTLVIPGGMPREQAERILFRSLGWEPRPKAKRAKKRGTRQ